MRQMYFEQFEKLSFWEELVYNHVLDEDIMLVKRDGFSFEFILICFLVIVLAFAVICH